MKGVGNELQVSRKQRLFVLQVSRKQRLFVLTSFCFLIFAALSYAQTQVPDQPNNQLIGVAAIEAYTKELDTFKKKNPNRVRFFGNVASWDQLSMRLNAPSPKWKEFKSRKPRESAYLKAQRLPINTLLNFRPLNDVPSIEAYSKSLDGFKKRNPNRARIFGNIVSPNQATYPVPYNAPRYWEEFPTRRARESAPKGYDSYDGAEVWMRNGKLLIAEIQLDRTFVSASRRAIHYFRPNGTLAKIYNQYFENDYHTIQETIYDIEGKVLRVRRRCVDTGGRALKFVKCPANLPPQISDPVYRKVEELPLNDLLRSE